MDKKKIAGVIGLVILSIAGAIFGPEFKKEVCGCDSVLESK